MLFPVYKSSYLSTHRNWTMKRFTRRCWSQPLSLTAAGCLITSTLTSMISVSRWARKKHASHTVYASCVKVQVSMWKRAWSKAVYLLLYFAAFSHCRLRPSVRKWLQPESPTLQQVSVLAPLPRNPPPRNPKFNAYFIPTHTQHIPPSCFSHVKHHFIWARSLTCWWND